MSIGHHYLLPPINPKTPSSPQHRQPESHPQTIPDNIQLASLDLFPSDRDFSHWDVGTLGQHQHFDVENPTFRVHVWDDVGQRGPGEQLETALGVFDCCRFGCGEETEQQVERVHEGVAEERTLDWMLVSPSGRLE